MRSGEMFAGEQLRLARLTHGRSLDEVGEAVGTTRQYLHQLETGSKIPTDEMQEALAAALGITRRFFAIRSRSLVAVEQVHFRKQATTPLSVTSQALARGTLLDMLVERLDNQLTLPTVSFPEFPVTNEEDIEKAAEQCRIHWGLGLTGPITNMARVIENAGAVISYFKGISERIDALSMDRKRPLVIRNEAKPAACRLRFDLAHECGHLVMHRGLQTGDRLTEGQAHRFSSAFLLPRSAFAREFPAMRQLSWPVIFQLKLRWKVSARAIIRRAYDLGRITAAQYRVGNIHLVKTGQTRIEQYDDSISTETPELLEAAFTALERNQAGSIRRLAQSIGFDDDMFILVTGHTLLKHNPQKEHANVFQLFKK